MFLLDYKVVYQKRVVLALFASLIFSSIFVLIPWEVLKPGAFLDLAVYKHKFMFETSVLVEKNVTTVWGFFINEGLWDVLIRYLSADLGIPLDSIFSFIALFTIFSFCKYIAVRHGILAMIFVVNPLVVDFAFSQMRMALAISVFIVAIDLNKVWIKYFLFIVASFFHTALVLFVGVYFLSISYLKCKKSRVAFFNSPMVFVLFVAFSVFFVIGPLRFLILSYLGDRRVHYPAGGSTLLYASFWFFYAFVILLASRNRRFVNVAAMMSLVWVLVFLFATMFGMYGARFLSAAYPFIVSSMLVFIGMEFKKVVYRSAIDGEMKINVVNLLDANVFLSASMLGMFLVYSAAQWRYWFI